MSDRYLLTFVAPPALEEPLVDWLLERESQYGFSSFPVNGHSSRHDGLTLAEQVSGRKKHIRFEMHLSESDSWELVHGLQRDFAGTGIHYWITPIIECGRV